MFVDRHPGICSFIAGVKNEAGIQGIVDQGGKVIYVATGYEALRIVMDGKADLCLAPRACLDKANLGERMI
jgi:hypothetical protein